MVRGPTARADPQPAANTATMTGEAQVLFNALPAVMPLVKEGKLRPLGVTSAKAVKLLPGVPTIGASVPGYAVTGWLGLGAPKGTPAEVVDRINKEMKAFGESRGYDLGRNPMNSLLALFPGGLIIVPALITYWNGTKRVQGTSALVGREPVNGWLVLVLYLLLSPAMWAYLQVSLNHVWEQELSPAPGEKTPPAPEDPMPPKLQGT